jgi:acyl-[acyl-carrier-protein]-phospholipid O-acyltransferase/long-chain-fatty-acid--[acyl-carrier-protein] ligase
MKIETQTPRLVGPLVVCQALSALGENLLRNVLGIVLLWSAAGAGMGWLAPVSTAAFVLPSLLLSGYAGYVADRMDKALLARRLKLIEIGVGAVATTAMALPLPAIWTVSILLGALLASGCIAAMFFPVKYGILPERLSLDRLPSANALMEGTTFLAILAGTTADGLLAGSIGIAGIGALALAVAVLSYAAARRLPLARAPIVPSSNTQPPPTPWASVRELGADRHLLLAALANTWFWIVGATALSLLPSLARATLHGQPVMVSYLAAGVAVGVAAGTAIAAFLSGGRIVRLLSVIGTAITALALLDLWRVAGQGQAMHVAIDLFVATIGAGLLAVPTMAEVQARAPAGRRAATLAALNVMSSGGMVLSSAILLLAGMAGASTPALLGITGAASFVVSIAIARTSARNKVGDALWMAFRATHRVKLNGGEHLPTAGSPAVLIANHVSWLDAALLVAALDHRPVFAIDAAISKLWWMRPTLALVDAVPTDASKPQTMRRLIEAVRAGRTAIVFPEGRITITGSLMTMHGGALMVAEQAGVPIIPARIEGLERSPLSRLDRTQTNRTAFPRITLTVWPARRVGVSQNLVGRGRREAALRWLSDLMAEMAFRTTKTDLTILQAIRAAGQSVGMGREAVADPIRGILSYRKLLAGAAIYGRRFLSMGLQPGARVGLLLPNAGGTLVSLLGLNSAGMVPVMLNPRGGASALGAARQATAFTTIITARALVTRLGLGPVVEGLEQAGVTFHYLEDLRPSLPETLRGLLRRGRALVKASPDDPAIILMTSGSSGTPKAIVHSHRSIMTNVAQVGSVIDFGRRDKVLNAMPLFHAFGLSSGTLLPLVSGARVFLYPNPLDYRGVPYAADMLNATVMFVTQVFAEGYLRRADTRAFRSVRLVVGGASKFRESTIAAWNEKFGLRILVGYGLTETAPVLALNTPASNRFGTAGRLLPGIQAKLLPVEGIQADGVLHVRGDNVMLGTMSPDRPGELQRLADGWFDTGDVITMEEDGHIRIVDRLGRFAKVGGEKVSLDEIERLAGSVWAAADHIAVAVPDDRKGERVVLLTTRADARRQPLVDGARKAGMSDLTVPADVLVIDKVPMLGSGKPDLAAAKALVADMTAVKAA